MTATTWLFAHPSAGKAGLTPKSTLLAAFHAARGAEGLHIYHYVDGEPRGSVAAAPIMHEFARLQAQLIHNVSPHATKHKADELSEYLNGGDVSGRVAAHSLALARAKGSAGGVECATYYAIAAWISAFHDEAEAFHMASLIANWAIVTDVVDDWTLEADLQDLLTAALLEPAQ